MKRFLPILALFVFASGGVARAEDPAPSDERGAQVIVTDPNYGQQQQTQQVQVVEQNSPAQQGRGLEYGGSIFVPVWIDSVRDYFNPGIGLDLRVGWELGGGLSVDGHLGFTYNGVRGSYYDTSLQSTYLGVGLRYGFLNRTALVPFLQAGLQLNLWSVCAGASCKGSFDTINFGLYGGAGLIYEASQNLSVDFGLNFMSILGNNDVLFDGFATNLQPFIGVTLYY